VIFPEVLVHRCVTTSGRTLAYLEQRFDRFNILDVLSNAVFCCTPAALQSKPLHIISPRERNLASAGLSQETSTWRNRRDAAIQVVAERVLSLTRASGVAVALWDGGAMVCVASAGSHAPGLGSRLQVGAGFSGECVRTGRSLRCDDTESDARVDRHSCSALDVRSILAVPIKQSDRVTGLIEAFSRVANKFSTNDELVLQEVAGLIAGGPKTSPAVALKEAESVGGAASVGGTARSAPIPASEAQFASSSSPAQHWADEPEFPNKPTLSRSLGTVAFLVSILIFGMALLRVWPAFNHKDKAGATANVQPKTLESDLHDPGKTLSPPSYSDDLSVVQKMAEQGDAAAQFALGSRYATGEDVKQDYVEAARWFSRAAEQGHTTAQSILCAYYWQGRGVPRDLEKAYFWSLVAQAAGDQPSKERATLLASRINASQLAAIKEQADNWLRERTGPNGKPHQAR
jgi:putative methionine-R-sulfoxide reductase with GAF domain